MKELALGEIVSRFGRGRIAVIGDLMLDVYLWGRVTRISPEAPVPVVSILRRTSCLGGAGNVLRNVATLGAHPFAYGVVGPDLTGDELVAELTGNRIVVEEVTRDDSRPTTEKKRVIAGSQQLLREDYEATHPVADPIRQRMVDRICRQIRNGELDAVIFEDYNKGMLAAWMLEAIIAEARRCGVVTALDPKPGNIPPVRGLTVMKPNRVEAFALARLADRSGGAVDPLQDEALLKAAQVLLAEWEPDFLLISLAAQGLALFQRNAAPQVIPTRAREVFDVSGAGDTVTATFALSMVAGATPAQAAELANRAAGVVVAKVGTVPVFLDELKAALEEA